MNPSRLNGMKVFGAEGFVLGEVEGVDVDLNAWKVSTLHVSLNDEAVAGFGLDKPFMSKITVCLPIKIVKSVGDAVFLNKSVVNLDEVARECLSGPTKLAGKRNRRVSSCSSAFTWNIKLCWATSRSLYLGI